jgi:hypothetical protein
VEVWVEAFNVARAENVSPWDALLTTVNRRAQRVRWVDAVIEEMLKQHRKRCDAALAEDPTADVNPDVPPDEVRIWLEESRKEERTLSRASKMAIDAGVAEAMVRRIEREGQQITDALVAALDAIGLDGEDRIKALTTLHDKLNPPRPERPMRALPGGFTDDLLDGDADEPDYGGHD